MKILIADENRSQRNMLVAIVTRLGHESVEANNGPDAIELFEKGDIDFVLLDTLLPIINGIEVLKTLRKTASEAFVPVIALIPATEHRVISEAIKAGSDDFILKPVDSQILSAKLVAMERILELHRNIVQQRQKVLVLQQEQYSELKLADHVHSAIVNQGREVLTGLESLNHPTSMFSGDSVFTCRSPHGSLVIMLADFTGHGLSASIGALPSSDIFYSMVEKGFAVSDIVIELNRKLYKLLPKNMFCAACIFEVSAEREHIAIWNGGVPTVRLLDHDSNVVEHIESFNPPLGILADKKFLPESRIVSCKPGQRIVMHSDGLTSTTSEKGQKIRKDVIDFCIQKSQNGDLFDTVTTYLNEFTQHRVQRDDISFLVYEVPSVADRSNESEERKHTIVEANTWSFCNTLDIDVLRSVNPIPLVLNMFMEYTPLKSYREKLFTILTELYTNALDHGLLDIDSGLKNSAEGFQKYYQVREDRLKLLKDGWIKFEATFKPTSEGGCLVINVSDSGNGFDVEKMRKRSSGGEKFHGRGIKLLYSLSDTVEYSERGSSVKITLKWDNLSFVA